VLHYGPYHNLRALTGPSVHWSNAGRSLDTPKVRRWTFTVSTIQTAISSSSLFRNQRYTVCCFSSPKSTCATFTTILDALDRSTSWCPSGHFRTLCAIFRHPALTSHHRTALSISVAETRFAHKTRIITHKQITNVLPFHIN
jgi:hypothetical protein